MGSKSPEYHQQAPDGIFHILFPGNQHVSPVFAI